MKGQMWSAASLGVLLYEGIGDTIRISLTPKPGGDRREEVYACLRIAAGAGAAVVFAERDGVPGMRQDDEHNVSGTGGADAGIHSRHDADVEDAV